MFKMDTEFLVMIVTYCYKNQNGVFEINRTITTCLIETIRANRYERKDNRI